MPPLHNGQINDCAWYTVGTQEKVANYIAMILESWPQCSPSQLSRHIHIPFLIKLTILQGMQGFLSERLKDLLRITQLLTLGLGCNPSEGQSRPPHPVHSSSVCSCVKVPVRYLSLQKAFLDLTVWLSSPLLFFLQPSGLLLSEHLSHTSQLLGTLI